MSGFHFRGGGGGAIEPPKTGGGGGGFGKRAQLTGTINQSLGSLAPKAPKTFLSTKIGRFFFTKHMANDDFSEPPRRADSKNPIFFFPRFLGLSHLQGPGIRLVRNHLEERLLDQAQARASYTPLF